MPVAHQVTNSTGEMKQCCYPYYLFRYIKIKKFYFRSLRLIERTCKHIDKI